MSPFAYSDKSEMYCTWPETAVTHALPRLTSQYRPRPGMLVGLLVGRERSCGRRRSAFAGRVLLYTLTCVYACPSHFSPS